MAECLGGLGNDFWVEGIGVAIVSEERFDDRVECFFTSGVVGLSHCEMGYENISATCWSFSRCLFGRQSLNGDDVPLRRFA